MAISLARHGQVPRPAIPFQAVIHPADGIVDKEPVKLALPVLPSPRCSMTSPQRCSGCCWGTCGQSDVQQQIFPEIRLYPLLTDSSMYHQARASLPLDTAIPPVSQSILSACSMKVLATWTPRNPREVAPGHTEIISVHLGLLQVVKLFLQHMCSRPNTAWRIIGHVLPSVCAHISAPEASIRSMTPFIIRQQDPNIPPAPKPRTQFECRHSNSVHRHKINWAALSPPATLHSGMLQKHNSKRGQRTRMWVVEFGIKAGAVQLQFF